MSSCIKLTLENVPAVSFSFIASVFIKTQHHTLKSCCEIKVLSIILKITETEIINSALSMPLLLEYSISCFKHSERSFYNKLYFILPIHRLQITLHLSQTHSSKQLHISVEFLPCADQNPSLFWYPLFTSPLGQGCQVCSSFQAEENKCLLFEMTVTSVWSIITSQSVISLGCQEKANHYESCFISIALDS